MLGFEAGLEHFMKCHPSSECLTSAPVMRHQTSHFGLILAYKWEGPIVARVSKMGNCKVETLLATEAAHRA